jgi:transcriptional regulator with XRE-family HTH domain
VKDPIRQPEIERAFATALKELRRERKLSQIDFAAKLTAQGRPLSKSMVTWLESGRTRITLADALAIADLFGISLAEMLERGQRRRRQLAHISGRWPR